MLRQLKLEDMDAAARVVRASIAWSFGRFSAMRRPGAFYEARGFTLIQETGGARNEENEPDTLYLWTR
jgi:hypothetical protein